MILPHNPFLSLSLPFPFFGSRPVSLYMSQPVPGLEELRTPFLLSPLEQSQRALVKGCIRVRHAVQPATKNTDGLGCNPERWASPGLLPWRCINQCFAIINYLVCFLIPRGFIFCKFLFRSKVHILCKVSLLFSVYCAKLYFIIIVIRNFNVNRCKSLNVVLRLKGFVQAEHFARIKENHYVWL